MASWILTQQWLISLVLVCLLLNEKKASAYLGGRASYFMWLLLPLCLVLNNLPHGFLVTNSPQIANYLIAFNEQAQLASQAMTWQLVWSVGAVTVLSVSIFTTIKLHLSCVLNPIDKHLLPAVIPNYLSVAHSAQVSSPMLLGVFKPRLVLPVDYQSQFTQSQLKLVLEHEICHFKRLDNLTNFIAVILLSINWFNPLAWLGFASFRRSQEIACDHVVLAGKGTSERIEYSKALVNCAQQHQHSLNVYSNYYQRDTIFKRINMLKSMELINQPAKVVAAVFSAVLLTTVAWAQPMPMTDNLLTDKEHLHPIMRVEPRYPIKAANDAIEGSVVLRFNIQPNGNVADVRVVKAIPSDIFNKESRRALKQWVYSKTLQGEKDVLVQLDFVMTADSKSPVNLINDIEKINIRND